MFTKSGVCLAVCTALACSACGGGFYKVDDAKRQTPAMPGTLGEFGYVTATINLQNSKLFTTPLYADSRDGDLAHLYAYAQFPSTVGGTAQAIPLYLIDLEKGSIIDTRGAELISHYPINPDSRGAPLFNIETKALKKTVGDTALKVWQLSGGLAEKVAGMAIGPQSAPLFDVVNQAAGILNGLASTDQSYEAHVAIPRNYDKPEYADVYLILPTDKHANVLPAAQAEADAFLKATNVSLCREGSNIFACVGSAKYDKLVYIIVDFKLDNHVSDPALLETVDSNCSLTSKAVDASKARTETVNILSPAQLALERSVNDRAERLTRIRGAMSDGKFGTAVNLYDDYKHVPPIPAEVTSSDLYKRYFAGRLGALDTCVATEERKIAGYDSVNGLLKFMESDFDFDKAAESELETQLVSVASYFPADQDKPLTFLTSTSVYQRAAARILQSNKTLYQRFYLGQIRQLSATKAPSTQADALAADVEGRLAVTSCDKCRGDAAASVSGYRALRPAVAPERVATLADASSVAAALTVVQARNERTQDPGAPSVARQLDDLRSSVSELTALPPAQRPANTAAAAKVTAAAGAARAVLQ